MTYLYNYLTGLLERDLSMIVAIVAGIAAVLLAMRFAFKRRSAAVIAAEEAAQLPLHDIEDRRQGVFGPLTEALAAQLPEPKKETADFIKLLRQAGIYQPSARASIYALRFVLLVTPLVIAGVVAIIRPPEDTFEILVTGGIAAAALSIVPRLYVYFHRRQRLSEIRRGLADMMDMLSMCLGGGMPLSPALEHVAQNLRNYPALALELRLLKRQAELGSLKRALSDFSSRIDLPEVRQVASMLARGEQLGTRLSKSLLDQADHFRATRRELATMQANKTPVILTLPLMFCFAPAVLILMLSPALLQLNDFFDPQQGESVLDANEEFSAGGVVRFVDGLDQSFNINPAPAGSVNP